MNTKFTEGPWIIKNNGYYFDISTSGNMEIADLCSSVYSFDKNEHKSGGIAEANAQLIAAAPDLYDALENCIDCLGDEFALPVDCIKEAKKALAKARGD